MPRAMVKPSHGITHPQVATPAKTAAVSAGPRLLRNRKLSVEKFLKGDDSFIGWALKTQNC